MHCPDAEGERHRQRWFGGRRGRRGRSPGGVARRVEARQWGSRSGTGVWKAALPWACTATKSTIHYPSSTSKVCKAAGAAKSSRHACPGSRGQARRPRSDSGTGHSFRASPRRVASWLLSSTHSCDPRSTKDSSNDDVGFLRRRRPAAQWLAPQHRTISPYGGGHGLEPTPASSAKRGHRGPKALASHVTHSRRHAERFAAPARLPGAASAGYRSARCLCWRRLSLRPLGGGWSCMKLHKPLSGLGSMM